jgi:phosphoadenosine phosphosulfate reductase
VSLVEHTLFGVIDKVQIAIDRIRQFEPPEGYYVAFSGGKDSCVVKDLVKRAGVKADYHYNLTTVDPPELVYFIREHHADVEVHKPAKSMWQLIIEKGLPTRHVRYCCEYLKEHGGKGRTVITGVRWEESSARSQRPMYFDFTSGKKSKKVIKHILNPIIDWTLLDVWTYLEDYKVPYCMLYDEGFDRLGCVLCPLAATGHRLIEAERWPKIANMYRIATNMIYARRGEVYRQKYGWRSGDEMFNWWLNDMPNCKIDPDQTVMFE